MHILYIHQHFATPKGSTGTRSYEFARRWIKSGHTVTMITGRYDLGGLSLKKGLIRRQIVDEIEVVVVGTRYSNKQTVMIRMLSFFCFVLLSVYAGLITRKVDVIYATSTPLTVGIPAMVLKWFKNVPFVFEVRDQWPAIPIEMGIITNKFLIWIALGLEKTIYRQSAAIVALSPGIADGIRAVLDTKKPVLVIPNSSDTDLFRPDVDGLPVRQEQGWGKKLVLLHFGAMGRANGLQFVVEAAERLRGNADIHFVMVGEGSDKQTLVERIKRRRLENVEVLDSRPKSELVKLVSACDVTMVVFADFPTLQHNSANKFFDSLSAGKPVLLNYSGWQRTILESNKAGFGCSLGDIDDFVGKVLYFQSHPEEVVRMGDNARRLALEEFNRDKLAAQTLEVITSVKT